MITFLVTTIELDTLYESYRRISAMQDKDGVIDLDEFKVPLSSVLENLQKLLFFFLRC